MLEKYYLTNSEASAYILIIIGNNRMLLFVCLKKHAFAILSEGKIWINFTYVINNVESAKNVLMVRL